MDIETVVRETKSLSRERQLELVNRIHDAVFAAPECGVDDELRLLLEKRIADDDADPNGGLTLEEFEERLKDL